jgi:transposase
LKFREYGTRPDFCEGADPESKGIVEALVGYVKSDLMIPEELSVADLKGANTKGVLWCNEANAQLHSDPDIATALVTAV